MHSFLRPFLVHHFDRFFSQNDSKMGSKIDDFWIQNRRGLLKPKTSKFDDSTTLVNDLSSSGPSRIHQKSMKIGLVRSQHESRHSSWTGFGTIWGSQNGSKMIRIASWRSEKAVQTLIEKRTQQKRPTGRPTGSKMVRNLVGELLMGL